LISVFENSIIKVSKRRCFATNATHETIVAKFGSRLSLNFRPREREIWLSPAGRFLDQPVALNFGIAYDGTRYGLPFGSRHTDFQFIEQHESFDRVVYRCRDFRIGVECDFAFVSPFYPQDKDLSTMPAIYVEITVRRIIDRNVRADDVKTVQVFCDARMTPFEEQGDKLVMEDRYFLADDHIHYQDMEYLKRFLNEHPDVRRGVVGSTAIGCVPGGTLLGKTLFVPVQIAQGKAATVVYAIGGYVSDPVLHTGNEAWRFDYTHRFASVVQVLETALKDASAALSKSASFASTLREAGLGSDYDQLLGFSMRSYAANTWWLSDKLRTEWFSVWEGNCLFHSTVDVEYNLGLFYYLLWPELLEIMFRNWRNAMKPDNISHDIGAILDANGAAYPHEMEIEENCNFILMLFAYYRMFAKPEAVLPYLDVVATLIRFNASCDKTGNGLPNKGTANTIDDSSDDVQFAEEQIYIGIKEYAAYLAAEELFALSKNAELATLCQTEAAKIRASIDRSGWLDDHYGVTLRSAFGSIHADSLYKAMGANASSSGKDAYSIYTANGLLYLWLVGKDARWDLSRLKTDVTAADRACATPFGGTHSSVDTSNVWISQNIWRDLCAGYLGIDLSSNIQKYWAFERYENQGARGGCFIDTYGWNKLNYYPRGITAIGYLAAMGGFSVDGVAKVVRLKPAKVPLTVLLLPFADWTKGIVPKAVFTFEDGQIRVRFEHKERLEGYRIIID